MTPPAIPIPAGPEFEILNSLFGGAIVFTLLIAAIKWLDKDRAKVLMTLEVERSKHLEAFTALHSERYDHLLESQKECLQDREHLRTRLNAVEARQDQLTDLLLKHYVPTDTGS